MAFSLISTLITYVSALLGIAFFTLLERNVLGYIQERNGPNKVSITGLPQPLADAANLLIKEISSPTMANFTLFIAAPLLSLTLSLYLWSLYPINHSSNFISMSILIFLCISSLNVVRHVQPSFSQPKYSIDLVT